jgi:hypothetical protein
MGKILGLNLLVLMSCLLLFSCGSADKNTLLTIYPKTGIGEKIYLYKVPYNGSNELTDSVTVLKNDEPIYLNIKGQEEAVYLLGSSFNGFKVKFIRDSPNLTIHADFFSRTFSIDSKATNSLLQFRKEQDLLAVQRNPVFFKNTIRYADTVQSAAAFALVYDDIDFGKDYQGLQRFIARAVKRFPDYPPVKEIEQRALNFLKIMEEEFAIADQLPWITLPDQNNRQYATSKLNGKLYFIDFWSTFSPSATAYTTVKKNIRNSFPADQLAMISVALEPEPAVWKRFIANRHLAWPQLIDQKVWEGTAIRTLKFDSIPENFLVAPNGKILAKSIPRDSLLRTIRKYVHQ